MANKAPKMKLKTMRIMYGILAGLFLLQFLMNLINGNTTLAVIQLILVPFLSWYAINPPAYIRKRFIQ